MSHRTIARPRPTARLVRQAVMAAALLCTAQAAAGEPDPERSAAASLPADVITAFTRQVQPLLTNKCGAGACHGGPAAHAPRFARPGIDGRFDRGSTLANIETLLDAIGSDRDPQRLLARFATRHPTRPQSRHLVAQQITPRERRIIETWVASVRAHGIPARADARVRPVSAEEPEAQTNPFRDLLAHGGPAPNLPPPPPVRPRSDFSSRVDLRTSRPEERVRPAAAPRSRPPGRADSRPADRDDRASPAPSATGSR